MRELTDQEVFGASSAPRELSDADVFGPAESWTDNLRDPAAAVLKIGPTALKGVADLARLATGDSVGVGLSNAMKTGMESIDQVVGSERLRAQKAAVNQALQDDAVGLSDLPGVLMDNPRALTDAAVSTIGSMFLPMGAAAGTVKALPLAAKLAPTLARVAPAAAATGATVVTGAAQNAAETFADTEGRDLSDRYTGAGISGAASLVLGKLLGGGAEGVVARRLAGEGVARGVLEGAKSAVKTGAKEFAQEFGEEGSNYVGKQVAKDEAINPNALLKQGTYGGVIGFGVGGASDVATNAGNLAQPNAARQVAAEIERAAQEVADVRPDAQAIRKLFGNQPEARNAAEVNEVRPLRNAQAQADQATPMDPAPAAPEAAQPVQQATAPQAPTAEATPQAAPAAPRVDVPILQNRDRSTPSSIAQMQSIASAPDYGRLGFSRDFANGAPVVAGGTVPQDQVGLSDIAVAADGRRIPVQYAVLEASDVLASNQVDGTTNADYGNQAVQRIRAIAGNGRIAGLQAAYGKGTTSEYLSELVKDDIHGISPDVIRRMRAPVLVRVMPADQVTADIGDVSNTTGNLNLSAVEQANNDAQRVNLDALQFAEDGGITPEAVRQFVRAMPQAEQGGLIDTNGQPSRQAVDRINAAVFAKAYGNDQLVRLFAQAQDPEARLILSALAQVAPKMARLEGTGAADIRNVVTQAAEIAVNARREGKPLARAAQQMDMAADPDVAVFLDLFAANPRSPKPIMEALGRVADMAYTEATKPAQDMFGEVPRASREDIINQLRPTNERTSAQTLEDTAGRQRVEQVAQGPTPEPARAAARTETQASRPAAAQGQDRPALTSYTRQDIEQRIEKLEQAQRERERKAREAEQRAQADEQRDTFTLTGSDRDADVAASRGQRNIFADESPVVRSDGEGAGISAGELAQVVDELLAEFAHQAPVRILDTAVGVLPGVREQDAVSGAVYQGRIHLFLDQLPSQPAAVRTLWHELLHYGLRRFLTREDYQTQMLELYRRDTWVRGEANRWAASDEGRTAARQGGEDYARARGVDEALALLAEKNQGGIENTGLGARVFRSVVDWLADMADKFKFSEAASFLRGITSTEARAYVRSVFAQIREDAPATYSDWAFTAEASYSRGVSSLAQPWTVPEPGAGDAFIRSIQNNKIDLKRVREAIASQYGEPSMKADAYLAEELYHGKVAARVEALHKDYVEPILAKIAVAGKNVGLTLDDVNLYLHARHAPERNAAMKAINPDMENNAALSGMSDEDAADVLRQFDAAGKTKALELIAKDVDQLLADNRAAMVADGLKDAGVVQAWEAAYQHYVPLQRDIKGSGTPKGMGFSVRGPESKRAVGSNRQVVNILANIVAQAETTAIRAEKATVGRTLLAMARQYPNPDFWKVDTPPRKPRINKDTGLVERNAIDPLFQTADNVVVVKDYGQEHFIVFNQDSERAMAVARAMKNLDMDKMPRWLQIANKGTRFMASLLTARNPEFWLTNLSRDIQGALINMDSTEADGLQSKAMSNLPNAFKGMHSLVRGEGKGQWARYAQELKDAGGTTGYMQSFDSSDERMQDLQREVDRLQQGKADPRRLARLTLEFVDDYNDIIENAVRLSVFQAARDAGVPTPKAASIAKNITINFNRKGNASPSINALYMFFNAGVQGTARMAQALVKSRRTQAVAGALVGIGFLLDMLNRMAADDDDETGRNRYDLIPEFEKTRNWLIMNPLRPGEYVKIPLPIGFHLFPNAGRLMSDALFRKDPRNASEYGWAMAGMVLDTFSPMGTGPSISQFLLPSLADPVVQVAENKSFTGGPVYKSADRGFGPEDPRPAHTRYFESTPDVWKATSRMLNDLTGGDDVKAGAINVEPDILRHSFYTLTGGPGRALDRTVDVLQSEARGQETSVNRVPIVSRFYGENDDRQRERVFYDDRKRVADAKAQFDYYSREGRRDLARKVAEELGDGDFAKGMRMMREFNSADGAIRKLNAQIKRELERQASGEDRALQLQELKRRRTQVMSRTVNREDETEVMP